MLTDRRSRRGDLAQWLPLAMTAAAVAVGIAAWVWSERRDNDDDDDTNDEPNHQPSQPGITRTDKSDLPHQQNRPTLYLHDGMDHSTSSTLYTRMTNVISRAPSPQQFLSDTSKRMAAGVAAVWPGKSLDFRDHERWQEEEQIRAAEALLSEQGSEDPDLEAEYLTPVSAKETAASMGAVGVVDQQQRQMQAGRSVQGRGKRKTVAVVVSSVIAEDQDIIQAPGHRILEQLGHHQATDLGSTDLLILIYAPSLKTYPSTLTTHAQPGNPDTFHPLHSYFILEAQAIPLVPHPAHILPFTTPTGYVHLLRHLAPNVVYIQENLAGGEHESLLPQLKGWVGQMVLAVPEILSMPEARSAPKGVDIVHIGPQLREHLSRRT